MKNLILIITALLFLALITAAIWAYLAFFYTKPLTQQELADLTPDWTRATQGNWSPWHTLPDGTKEWNPAANYNAWLATIPDEDKAWPILVDVWYANMDYTRDLPYGFFPEEDLLWEIHENDYRSEQFRSIAEQLVIAAHKPVMGIGLYDQPDPFERAANIKYGLKESDWKPSQTYSPNPLILLAQYNDLSQTRTAVHILKTAAASALLNNNPDDYLRYTRATLEFTRHSATQIPTMIHQLVQISILAEATDLVRWGLANNPDGFTTLQLNQLEQAFAQHESLHYQWEGEALQTHDFFRRVAGPDGTLSIKEQAVVLAGEDLPSGRMPSNLPDSQLGQSIQRPLVIVNQMNMQLAKNTQTLWNNITIDPHDIYLNDKSSFSNTASHYMEITMPQTGKMPKRFRGVNQQLRATRIAIALHIYKNTNNHFPDSLSQLGLPKHILLDEFTGKQLLYKNTSNGPVLYSTGDNRTDNNATQRFITKDHGELGSPLHYTVPRYQMFLTNQQAQQFVPGAPVYDKGDWVLYPLPFGDPKPVYIPEDDLP